MWIGNSENEKEQAGREGQKEIEKERVQAPSRTSHTTRRAFAASKRILWKGKSFMSARFS